MEGMEARVRKEVRTTTTTTTTTTTAAIIHAQQAGRQAKWEGFVFYCSDFSLSGEESKRKGHLRHGCTPITYLAHVWIER